MHRHYSPGAFPQARQRIRTPSLILDSDPAHTGSAAASELEPALHIQELPDSIQLNILAFS
jgi:hypothetical protein